MHRALITAKKVLTLALVVAALATAGCGPEPATLAAPAAIADTGGDGAAAGLDSAVVDASSAGDSTLDAQPDAVADLVPDSAEPDTAQDAPADAQGDAQPDADAAADAPGCGAGKAEVWLQTYPTIGLLADATATTSGFVALSGAVTHTDVWHFDPHGAVTLWASLPGTGQRLAASPAGEVAVFLPGAATPSAAIAVFGAAGAVAKTLSVEPVTPLPTQLATMAWTGFAAAADGYLLAGSYTLATASGEERHGFVRKYASSGAPLWAVDAGAHTDVPGLFLLSDGRLVVYAVACAGAFSYTVMSPKAGDSVLQPDGSGLSVGVCMGPGCNACPSYSTRFGANGHLVLQIQSQKITVWGPHQGAEFRDGPEGGSWTVYFASNTPMTFVGGGEAPGGDYWISTQEGGLARVAPDGNLKWHRTTTGVYPWVFSRFGAVFRLGSLGGSVAMRRSDAFGNDTCAAAVGCESVSPSACDDGNVCTADLCAAGKCTSEPLADGTFLKGGAHCMTGVAEP